MGWNGAVGGCVCLAMAGSIGIRAQTTEAQSAPAKIAVVSFSALVLQTNEAQRDLGALEKKYAPRQAQLQALNSEIETVRKQLGDTGDNLNDQERNARTQALNAKEKQLERAAEDYRNDTQADSQQVYQRVAEKVFAFVQDYARQKGLKAIIERGTDTAPIVWYAADDVDITTELIKGYNAKSGIAAQDGGGKVPVPGVNTNTTAPKPAVLPSHQP